MIAHAPNSSHGSFAIAFSYCLPVNISDSLETLCLYSLKCHTINGLTNVRARNLAIMNMKENKTKETY